MTTCTVAAIVALLGAMPAKGTTVTVPRSSLASYSSTQILKAKLCARRYGIQYVIDEDR